LYLSSNISITIIIYCFFITFLKHLAYFLWIQHLRLIFIFLIWFIVIAIIINATVINIILLFFYRILLFQCDYFLFSFCSLNQIYFGSLFLIFHIWNKRYSTIQFDSTLLAFSLIDSIYYLLFFRTCFLSIKAINILIWFIQRIFIFFNLLRNLFLNNLVFRFNLNFLL
jgi:hypothetical protein